MRCTECIAIFECAEFRRRGDGWAAPSEPDAAEAVLHAETCSPCSSALLAVRAGQDALGFSLDAERPARPVEVIVASARRRYRQVRWLVGAAAGGGLLLALALVPIARLVILPEVHRMLEPPPVLETRTYAVACLPARDVAEALQPFLPRPRNKRWEAEWFDARETAPGLASVTVRAMRSFLDSVPLLIRTIERDERGECRAHASVAPDGKDQ